MNRLRAFAILPLLGIPLIGQYAAPAIPPLSLAADTVQARIEAAQGPDGGELGPLTISELLAHFAVPGVSVAVVHGFEVIWSKGYGVADVATGRAVDTGTLFQAASMSKPVAAMAGMRLAEQGRLELDGDVNGILNGWRVPESGRGSTEPVTPRSLYSHTSGADDGFGFPGYPPGAATPSAVEILQGAGPSNVGPVRFVRPPYRAYKYSGGGSTLMQLVLSELTSTPFERLMDELVLRPLGMTGSTYEQPLPERWEPRAAHAHDRYGSPHAAPWHVYPEQAAAGLWTTPADLAKVIVEVQRALRGEGTLLAPASASAMTTPVGVGPFGAGFELRRMGEGWYFLHTGSNFGFRGQMIGHLRGGYGAVVMTNGDNGSPLAAEIVQRIARAYDWDATHQPLRR